MVHSWLKLVVTLLIFEACLCAVPDLSGCEVAARTEQGFVCGRRRQATDGAPYASFSGIPYAKQPLGELRFKELQPPEPYNNVFNATEFGPICPQVDVIFGPLLQPRSMAEDCIRININVPSKHFPGLDSTNTGTLLPVLFWLHGGYFSSGSGDDDLQGPEYLMTQDLVVVTINYRLHAFGFLSLYNKYFPGNNGLRDAITALKWVQGNIKNFGGDPERVTVGGQGGGAIMAHLLSLSSAADGLFKQVIACSGQAIVSIFSYAQEYTEEVNSIFFESMGIDSERSAKEIHDTLVNAPLSKILQANKAVLDVYGLNSFVPVIERPQPDFTLVISKDPEVLIEDGVGKDYPLLIGFTNNEAETFRNRLNEIDFESELTQVPYLTVPTNLRYRSERFFLTTLSYRQLIRYYYSTNVIYVNLDQYILSVNEGSFNYVSQRLVTNRSAVGAANTFLYEFAYPGEHSPIKISSGQHFEGAGHLEDMTYFFRVNSFLGPMEEDELSCETNDCRMKQTMTATIANFVANGSPALTTTIWPPSGSNLSFQLLETPEYNYTSQTPYMDDIKKYYDDLYIVAQQHVDTNNLAYYYNHLIFPYRKP